MKRQITLLSLLCLVVSIFSTMYIPEVTIFDHIADSCVTLKTDKSQAQQMLSKGLGLMVGVAVFSFSNSKPANAERQQGSYLPVFTKLGLSFGLGTLVYNFISRDQQPESIAAAVSQKDKEFLTIILNYDGFVLNNKIRALYGYHFDYVKQADEAFNRIEQALENIDYAFRGIKKYQKLEYASLRNSVIINYKKVKNIHKKLQKSEDWNVFYYNNMFN